MHLSLPVYTVKIPIFPIFHIDAFDSEIKLKCRKFFFRKKSIFSIPDNSELRGFYQIPFLTDSGETWISTLKWDFDIFSNFSEKGAIYGSLLPAWLWADWVGSKWSRNFFFFFRLHFEQKRFERTLLELLGTKYGFSAPFWSETKFSKNWQNRRKKSAQKKYLANLSKNAPNWWNIAL